MGLLIKPNIFKPYPQLVAAMSLRGGKGEAFGFNMSTAVGDREEQVLANRQHLAARLGFSLDRLAVQHQVHGDRVVYVDENYQLGDSDALYTNKTGHLLAVSVADCVPILIADPDRNVVAGVHSGWRGSVQNIVGKTLALLKDVYTLSAENLLVWVGPSAGQCCYEVGADVAGAFDSKHSRGISDGKYLFDNRGVVVEQLLAEDVLPERIEVDLRCTICDTRFQSYRRERERSGRMFAVIGVKEESLD
ncbi:MAG: peptidoglycan editing factor PgeF [Ignavibacteriae bacterium]|nr:peptidoglycan editing factor PgeF [Ignavibacteriota bacterium]MCB9216393.1 peptidoglycan editing factor PgeF [Ignavibacteria bacterium]